MLKTVQISANSKTGPIAVTYRSGEHETYGTCPTSCSLHPKSETGTAQIDSEYIQAVFDSVPRGGQAWTYSHFAAEALPLPQPNKTVINASCDNVADAVRAVELGRPAVYAAPLEMADQWPQKIHVWHRSSKNIIRLVLHSLRQALCRPITPTSLPTSPKPCSSSPHRRRCTRQSRVGNSKGARRGPRPEGEGPPIMAGVAAFQHQ